MSELDHIFPEKFKHTIRGEVYNIKQIKVGEFRKISISLDIILADQANIKSAVLKHFPEVINIIKVLSDIPPQLVEDLSVTELYDFVEAIIFANMDDILFLFNDRLPKTAKTIVETVNKVKNGDFISKRSSATGTDSVTSKNTQSANSDAS